MKSKLSLYNSLVIPVAIYANETWKSNNNLAHKLDVFHHRCLRELLKILWQDHVTNDTVGQRSGQWKLSEIVKERILKMLGHILRMPEERLVSGLCFLSKLVERVVAKQLTSHININKLDNPHQSAYKPGHSTETALLSIKNEVHLSLARGEPTALVLLDLSAAFDTIDHSILLSYLKSWFGLGGNDLSGLLPTWVIVASSLR